MANAQVSGLTDTMTTRVRIGSEVWYLVEDFDHLYRRWLKAYRCNKFFKIRYAGTDRFVNPRQIIYVTNYW